MDITPPTARRRERLQSAALVPFIAAIAALTTISCAPKSPPTSCPNNGVALSGDLPYADMRPLPNHWIVPKRPGELERPREFAIYSFPYAIASVKAYAVDPKEACIPFPADERWKPLDANPHYTEEKIGFAAKTWLRTKHDGTKELVVAFRGTQFTQWQDWWYANLVPMTQACCHNQYKAALFYAKSAVSCSGAERSEIPVIFTGHSLGGGLAEYCQRFIKNSKAITFDPSQNQGVLYSLGRRQTKKSAVRIYEKGEILSYLRFIASPDIKLESTPEGDGVRAIWMDFYRSNPLSAHSIHDLTMCLIKAADLAGDKGAKSVYDQMKRDWCQGKLQSGKVVFSNPSTGS